VADLTITSGARRAALGLLILVLLVGGGNLWASFDLTRGVQRTDAAQVASCQAANTARAQQVQLWDYILGLSAGKPQTAQQQKTAARFRAYLGTVFKSRDCSHLPR
jgi:hypothetical protein